MMRKNQLLRRAIVAMLATVVLLPTLNWAVIQTTWGKIKQMYGGNGDPPPPPPPPPPPKD